jgi:adenylate kinase family enzyme
MRIYIIGAAGSGKTTLAKKLSEIINVATTNLDDVFWCNTNNSYGVKRKINERNTMYEKILQKESWIIEGAYIEWPKKGFLLADKLVFLNIKESVINFRIIKRFLLRKLHIEKSDKKESIIGIYKLLNWNKKQRTKITDYYDSCDLDSGNIIELKNSKEITTFIKNVKLFNS